MKNKYKIYGLLTAVLLVFGVKSSFSQDTLGYHKTYKVNERQKIILAYADSIRLLQRQQGIHPIDSTSFRKRMDQLLDNRNTLLQLQPTYPPKATLKKNK